MKILREYLFYKLKKNSYFTQLQVVSIAKKTGDTSIRLLTNPNSPRCIAVLTSKPTPNGGFGVRRRNSGRRRRFGAHIFPSSGEEIQALQVSPPQIQVKLVISSLCSLRIVVKSSPQIGLVLNSNKGFRYWYHYQYYPSTSFT